MKNNKLEDLCFYHSGILEDRKKYFKLDVLDVVQTSLTYMFDKDLKKLLFKDFNEIWKIHDIHLIHQFALEWENLNDYYNLLYEVILDHLVESNNHLEKVILFYLLFAIQQTMNNKVLISLDLDLMEQLYFFFKECQDKQDQEIFVLFNMLNNEKAFLLSTRVGPKTLAIHPSGLPYTVTKRNKEQLKDIVEEKNDDYDRSIRKESMEQLLKAGEAYHKSKQRQNVNLHLTDPHFASRCVHTLNNINNK